MVDDDTEPVIDDDDDTEVVIVEEEEEVTLDNIVEVSTEEGIVAEEPEEVATEEEEKNESNSVVSEDGLSYTAEITRRGGVVYVSELRVKVLDSEGKPIEGILVTIHSDPKVAVTGVNGIAVIKEVEVGEHTICFGYEGKMYEQDLVIDEPDLTIQSVDLDIITLTAERSWSCTLWCWIVGILVTILIHILLIVRRQRRSAV